MPNGGGNSAIWHLDVLAVLILCGVLVHLIRLQRPARAEGGEGATAGGRELGTAWSLPRRLHRRDAVGVQGSSVGGVVESGGGAARPGVDAMRGSASGCVASASAEDAGEVVQACLIEAAGRSTGHDALIVGRTGGGGAATVEAALPWRCRGPVGGGGGG